VVIAILFVLLGIVAIVEPAVAGLAVAILLSWLLILGGVAHLIAALSGGSMARVIWHVILGILYILGGSYLRTHPLVSLGTLTLLVAGILVAQAVIELIAYFRMSKQDRSGWMLTSVLITLLLGGLIWLHWPSSSTWAIGTVVGVRLLITGMSRILEARRARTLSG
jgi:uncharacterized membrane protein HdeD (DUF308 family)